MPNEFITLKEASRRLTFAVCGSVKEWMEQHPKEAAELHEFIQGGGKIYLAYPEPEIIIKPKEEGLGG